MTYASQLFSLRTCLTGLMVGFVLAWLMACSSAPHTSDSSSKANVEYGKASYYADSLHGNATASGEPYNKNALTAAHKTLPFGTQVKVTNTVNSKSVTVTINDRGPFVKGRIIDLSRAAFGKIAKMEAGVVPVAVTIIN